MDQTSGKGFWQGMLTRCSLRDRRDTLLGWAVSFGLHLTMILVLLLWTLPGRSGSTQGGTEVSVVLEPPSQQMQPAPEIPTSIQLPTSVPSVPQPLPDASSLTIESDFNLPQTAMPQNEQPIQLELSDLPGKQGSADAWQELAGQEGIAAGTGSFFGLKARGSRFVYVVDYSGSMHNEKLLAAKEELIRSIEALGEEMRFYVIFYSDGFQPMPAKNMVRATHQNKQLYTKWIQQQTSRGGTRPLSAMLKALSLNPDAIWLLSDGLFDPATCQKIQEANPQARIQIHTIAFHENTGERVLKTIAAQNRGHYRFVPPEQYRAYPR